MADYVIIGGGSAGCVLANRLSADPTVQVTLLEAGGGDDHFLYRMPAGFVGLMKIGMGNWNYESVPQPGLNGRKMYFPRGKVLGGSSSINGLVVCRGNAGDYDHWAQLGNLGWSYQDCLPYFMKLERYPEGDPEYRGVAGPIGVCSPASIEKMNPICRAWIEAGIEAGYRYNPDANGANQEGFGPAQANFLQGIRQSASTCYLKPVFSRPNLKIITNALATRIVVNRGRATAVEFAQGKSRQIVEADRDIILSGGAINSPQLLQLSGIGDPEDICPHGIAVQHELKGVGKNLCDHIGISLKQRITKSYSLLAKTKRLNVALSFLQYFLLKSGPSAGNGLDAWAFLKSRAGLEYPDLQLFCVPLMHNESGRQIIPEEGFMSYVNGCKPRSAGSVRICSADPAVAPAIDPNYFGDPEDLRSLREGIRIMRDLISRKSFETFRGDEYEPGVNATSDDDLDAFIRAKSQTGFHAAGTCKMGGDPMAVVDSSLRVRGLQGLRIVDASVIPEITSGNTNFPTMMIAEKAADMLINDCVVPLKN